MASLISHTCISVIRTRASRSALRRHTSRSEHRVHDVGERRAISAERDRGLINISITHACPSQLSAISRAILGETPETCAIHHAQSRIHSACGYREIAVDRDHGLINIDTPPPADAGCSRSRPSCAPRRSPRSSGPAGSPARKHHEKNRRHDACEYRVISADREHFRINSSPSSGRPRARYLQGD
jgi:hypothetical protein